MQQEMVAINNRGAADNKGTADNRRDLDHSTLFTYWRLCGCNQRTIAATIMTFAAITSVTDDVIGALDKMGLNAALYEGLEERWSLGCSLLSMTLTVTAYIVTACLQKDNNETPRVKYSGWQVALWIANLLTMVGSSILISDYSNSTDESPSTKSIWGSSLIAIGTAIFPGSAQLDPRGVFGCFEMSPSSYNNMP